MLELIYGLEEDWVGPAATNPLINVTYRLMQSVLAVMPIRLRWRWRLLQHFYRANYDLFAQIRVARLLAGEAEALAAIRGSGESDPDAAISAAEAALDRADADADAATADLWTEMRVWGEALFQSIHEQFSVPIYGSEYTRRGANLDTAHLPLSDAPALRSSFATVRQLPTNEAKAAALAKIASWRDAGPGGFYDDMGQVGDMPHYVHPSFPQNGDQSLQPSPVVDATSPTDQRYQNPPLDATLDDDLAAKLSSDPPALPIQRRTQMTWVETTVTLTEQCWIQLKYVPLLPFAIIVK